MVIIENQQIHDYKDKGARMDNQMKEKKTSSAAIGFEQQIWDAADILRGNMDASEYKHVVLGLIFLNIFQISLKPVIRNKKLMTMMWRIRTLTQK